MGQWSCIFHCCHWSGPRSALYCTVVWHMYLTSVKRQKLKWEEWLWFAFSPMQFVPVELTLFVFFSSLLLFSFSTVLVKTFEPVRLLTWSSRPWRQWGRSHSPWLCSSPRWQQELGVLPGKGNSPGPCPHHSTAIRKAKEFKEASCCSSTQSRIQSLLHNPYPYQHT